MMAIEMKVSSEKQISQMFNAISPTYDKVNRVLSFGIDRLWRKKLKEHLPPGHHLNLLDLATGTCDQILALMKTGKFDEAMGIDLAEEMLREGRRKIAATPYAECIDLKVASALEIPVEKGVFDCVTISFGIRNVADTLGCLNEMGRVLKKGGKALILEFSLPKNMLVRSLHLFYLRRLLPLVGGLISGEKSAYAYLNRTIEAYPHGAAFLKLMEQAGFTNPKAYPLTFGVATLYVGTKT
jgi:demethylmenaquinone methyltransferase / 2-methoxy-6-polyprenyl-1,4-benzoquinol methylase